VSINDFFLYNTEEELKNLSIKDYSDYMARILCLGLVKDSSFYEWCILNFNDIMDKDDEALSYIIERQAIIKQFFEANSSGDKIFYLNFGEPFVSSLNNYFKDELTCGECHALGMIASAWISYKRQLLSKEEFYELRDMFVPFGLTISLDKYDVDKVYDIITKDNNYQIYMDKFVLLKKTGKATISSNVTKDEINDALNTLIVEWD